MLPVSKYQRKLLYLFIYLLCSGGLVAQSNFYNQIGDSGNDIPYSIINTDDGNLMLTFSTSTTPASDDNIALIKVSEDGNLIWKKVYGGNSKDFPRSLIQTGDGGFAILASTYSYGSGHEDFLLIKTDASGSIEWSKTYGGSQEERAFNLKQTPDGGYILGGSTQSYGYGYRDAYIVKTDASGNTEWSTSLGGGQADNCFTIQVTSEGNYLLTGSEYSFGPGPWGFWIIELDPFGQVNWIKTYGGFGEEHSRIIEKTNDGNYLIFSHTTSFGEGNWDYLVTKVTPDGDLLWSKTYGGPQSDFTGSVIKKDNGNFLILGHTESFGEGAADIGVIEIDHDGNVVWARTYGTPADEKLTFGVDLMAASVSDGGLVIVGHTTGGSIGNTDVMFIKTNATGDNDCIGEDFTPTVNNPSLSEDLITIAPVSGVISNDVNVAEPGENIQIEEQCIIPPMAEFLVSDTDICEGDCITLTDLSQNADDYTWEFSGGIPSDPDDPPSGEVCFPDAGVFPVTLTVENTFGTDSYTANVFVSAPQPVSITGDPLICENTSAILEATAGFSIYQWSTGSTDQSITVSDSGTYFLSVTDAAGCQNAAVFNVEVSPLPDPEIIGPTSFCEGDTIEITLSANFSSIVWSDNSMETPLSVSEPGTYTVTVTDMNDCSGIATTLIQDSPLPVPEILGSLSFCTGGSTQLSSDQVYPIYYWSNGSNESSITVQEEGLYSLTVTDQNDCSGSTEVNITEATELSPQITGTLAFCEGSNTTLDAGPGYETYTWSNGVSAQSVIVTEPGTYSVSVTDAGGCSGIQEVLVTEQPLPVVTILGSLTFCPGGSTELDAGSGFQSYLWSNGTTGQVTAVAAEGDYSVTVTDINGCSNFSDVFVTENENSSNLFLYLGEDQTIQLGEEVHLEALHNLNENEILQFVWTPATGISCDSCFHQSVAPTQTTTYSAILTDTNGCTTFDEITIIVEKNRAVFVPNIYSPNNDGFNDQLIIFAGGEVESVLNWHIFDRWGELVFKGSNFPPNAPTYGWNGKFRGVPCNSGVFTWVAEISFKDGEIVLFKGDVTLIR